MALVITILLPFAVQFIHSFSTHEQSFCHAQNKAHFDTHEFDCAVFHFKINTNTVDFSLLVLKNHIFKIEEKITSVENQISSIKLELTSSRAPPYLFI